MEFAQFYPLIMAEPDLPAYLIPPYLELVGKLYNDQDQSIHEKYGLTEKPAALKARDRLSRALFTEIEVEASKVYLDLRGVTREDWCTNLFAAEFWDLFTGRCRVLERPVSICPAAHFSMGGLSIKADCSTTVDGLYACGEAAGGLHGANRHGGNALTETIVFGARAGAAAAEKARESQGGEPGPLARELAGQVPAGGKGKDSPAGIKKELKEIMWQKVGIIRSRESLLEAETRLEELKNRLRGASLPSDPRKLPAFLELDLGLTTAGLIIASALRREESRGAHFRVDFPETDDDNWRKRNKVSLVPGDREEWSLEPLQATESLE
jgi:succinate dehydrogenase/fumarate reductase flavoprotein subunit